MSFVAWSVVTINSLYTRFPPYACPDSTFIIQCRAANFNARQNLRHVPRNPAPHCFSGATAVYCVGETAFLQKEVPDRHAHHDDLHRLHRRRAPLPGFGRELRRRGHEVSICAFSSFESAVKAEGLGFKPVSGDVKTFMSNLMNGANGVAFLKQVRDTMREFIEPFLSDLEAATEGAQAIVGTYFRAGVPVPGGDAPCALCADALLPHRPQPAGAHRLRAGAAGGQGVEPGPPTSWATCSSARWRSTTSPTGGSRGA